jgi:hypothetical protein
MTDRERLLDRRGAEFVDFVHARRRKARSSRALRFKAGALLKRCSIAA